MRIVQGFAIYDYNTNITFFGTWDLKMLSLWKFYRNYEAGHYLILLPTYWSTKYLMFLL